MARASDSRPLALHGLRFDGFAEPTALAALDADEPARLARDRTAEGAR